MKTLHEYGTLLLASRLRRVSELLYQGVDAIYAQEGVGLSSRAFPILFLLRDHGAMGIVELAEKLGQTHPAVTQMSRKLRAFGVVKDRVDRQDSRRRLLELTPKGAKLMMRMGRVWDAISLSAAALAEESGQGFLAALEKIDASLQARSFELRISERLQGAEPEEVIVVPFAPGDAADFKRLNLEWLEKYFRVEPVDEEVLSQPGKSILSKGGRIFMAKVRGEAVGTCALIPDGDRVELSKMAVTSRFQGLGIGRKLLQAAIAEFPRMGARELFLESNSRLTPALRLYERTGFVHAPRPGGKGHYERADVHMVYRGKPVSAARRKRRSAPAVS